MSNEFKDWWEDFTPVQKKIYNICMEYPFLIPRDIDDNIDEDFDYSHLDLEIPNGWHKLFFQMCDDIKPLLMNEGLLWSFYFLQIKEKYNTLRCYSNGTASQEVESIINKYGQMAYYVCTKCGRPAVYETQGYFASYCDDCWKDFVRNQEIKCIKFEPYYEVIHLNKDKRYTETISFESEWNRYLRNFKE